MSGASYYAKRYRTLFSPQALDFAARPPRPNPASFVYTPAPTGVHTGLPRAARAARNPGVWLTFLVPVVLTTGLFAYLEYRDRESATLAYRNLAETLSPEEVRHKKLLEAYGDRESLERLEEVMLLDL